MTLQSILGNFALILFLLTLGTGIVWALDRFYLAPIRRRDASSALEEFDARSARLLETGVKPDPVARAQLVAELERQPAWVAYTGSFFPVIAAVFLFRSFLFEPFKIPSSSMVPTLQIGDLILVNKYTYGIRLPIVNKKIVSINNPKRGDVMVFKFPKDPSLDYIKRVVGIPGDNIVYRNKRLIVNGQEVSYDKLPDYLDEERLSYFSHYRENLTGVPHEILNDDRVPGYVASPDAFPQHELCRYNLEGFECTVPAGHYLMMGDNRDNSLDSRYWGFVPDQNIVGKAFFVWMNLGNLKRIGSFQ
ncbi:MAG: signal peptidase [Pseudomonadota bacterium]|jgi:signal peptidase I